MELYNEYAPNSLRLLDRPASSRNGSVSHMQILRLRQMGTQGDVLADGRTDAVHVLQRGAADSASRQGWEMTPGAQLPELPGHVLEGLPSGLREGAAGEDRRGDVSEGGR
ncbi:hypothetical protein PAAG_11069 [Paracoccidioides lutzii Pb01]|uniref:Uncharacterized protein n=1 Tax=Paracoccidioides lutzii (strain ATCC MYA-826 / Pb01) TaxID=502779 RepID=A0A0A2V3R4_PARBA|nr:hypothetical protein PAAG_11069 [Paracoccidioides lutzii Pb01]KGQ02118.1 hypothetical protein PAAG_11069 [Paracoccidioides lutzii Pb01]